MSISRDDRILFVVIVLAVVAASAGLVFGLDAFAGADNSTTQTFDGNVSARLAALDGVAATREVVIQRGNETSRTVERVRLRPDSGAIRATKLSGPGRTDVRVSNESVLWLYDQDAETVTLLRQDRSSAAGRLDRVSRLVRQLNGSTDAPATGDTPESDVGVSPLPVVPAGGDSQQAVRPAAAQDRYSVSYRGINSVDGRQATVVEIAQTGSVSEPVSNYTQTLWLDAEWYYPIKQQTAWTQGGQRRSITTTYRNVTFNPGLGVETFVFDPPSTATVETPDTPDQQQYETVTALRADAELSVPEPALHGSFTLAGATRTTGRIDSIGLRYVNSSRVVTVAKLAPNIEPRTDGEILTVAGRRATYRNLGPTEVITWSCEGVQYKVGGENVPQDRLVDIAHSVGCE